MSDDSEMSALLSFSARIGLEPTLVQASTGNVSIKTNERLWVKASGTWLADAETCDILIPLDLACVRRSVFDHLDLSTEHGDPGRQPSIETAMHAVLPYRIVVHVHSVNSIAYGVRQDAPVLAAQGLKGLNWAWIPYVASGLPLAHAVHDALQRSPGTDVFLLGNHGLVICADTSQAAESLLWEVEGRLEIQPRPSPDPNYAVLKELASRAGWRLPKHELLHSLGTDGISRKLLAGGILYPCQALFWTDESPGVFTSATPDLALQQMTASPQKRSFLIVDGCGVIVSRRLSAAEYDVLLGLAHVAQRVDRYFPIRYLTDSELFGVSTNSGGYRARSERAGSFIW